MRHNTNCSSMLFTCGFLHHHLCNSTQHAQFPSHSRHNAADNSFPHYYGLARHGSLTNWHHSHLASQEDVNRILQCFHNPCQLNPPEAGGNTVWMVCIEGRWKSYSFPHLLGHLLWVSVWTFYVAAFCHLPWKSLAFSSLSADHPHHYLHPVFNIWKHLVSPS